MASVYSDWLMAMSILTDRIIPYIIKYYITVHSATLINWWLMRIRLKTFSLFHYTQRCEDTRLENILILKSENMWIQYVVGETCLEMKTHTHTNHTSS